MKKHCALLAVLGLSLSLSCGAMASADLAGSGTMEDPYQISTAEDLTAFARSVNDGSAGGYMGEYIVLTADIDLEGVDWDPIGCMNLEDMSDMSGMFFGSFDGQGHMISNLTFATDQPTCGAGIFGLNVGEVKNLVAKDISVTCTNDFSMAIGAVVGYNMAAVDNVTLTGTNTVTGVNCTGGIVGGSMGNVTNCSVEGTTIHVLGDNDFSSGRIIQVDVAECGGLVIGGGFGGVIDNCTAQGTVLAEGKEPVGLGGIAGCLEMMDSITNCTAQVEICTTQGGHAIGGLCGYSGTHSDPNVVAETEGIVTTKYPAEIKNCTVEAVLNVPGATHVGGLVGTGLYYFGEETAFSIEDCSVTAQITGAVTPGAVAGRAENSLIVSCEASVTLDGEVLEAQVGETQTMYESADQYEEEEPAA